MVAYSFKGRFAEPIATRTKQQTIRAVGRKRHTRPGERMTMTTGDRFHPKLIGSATCESVDTILVLVEDHAVVIEPAEGGARYIIGAELETFARLDGFSGWGDMRAFWLQTHPDQPRFQGIRIFWGDTFVAS